MEGDADGKAKAGLTSRLKKGFGLSSKPSAKAGEEAGAPVDAETSDKWETGSVTSTSSKVSRTSYISGKAASATAALKKGLSLPFKSSKPASLSMADLHVGDRCETVAKATMRQEESKESALLEELPAGTIFDIVQIGEGVRIKIKVEEQQGWISALTALSEPLVSKREDDFDLIVGEKYEVKYLTQVHALEDADSEVKAKLKPGTTVTYLEVGARTNFRAKVSAQLVTGWMTVLTPQGERMLAKASSKGKGGKDCIVFEPKYKKIKTLLELVLQGDAAGLKRLVEGGTMTKMMGGASGGSRAHLNSGDARGKTSLMYAGALGHSAVVEYLLAHQDEVDVNTVDDTQKSALHHASKRGPARRQGESLRVQEQIVKMLLEGGATLEARDHNGCTALMFAVANGDENVTMVLLKAQANVNVKDFEGHTPLDYALNFHQTRIVKVLEGHGAVGTMAGEETAGPDGAETAEAEAPVAAEGAAPQDEGKKKKKKRRGRRRHRQEEKKREEAEGVRHDGGGAGQRRGCAGGGRRGGRRRGVGAREGGGQAERPAREQRHREGARGRDQVGARCGRR